MFVDNTGCQVGIANEASQVGRDDPRVPGAIALRTKTNFSNEPDGISTKAKAYLLGGGIGSLSAAFMVRDGRLPGGNISILSTTRLISERPNIYFPLIYIKFNCRLLVNMRSNGGVVISILGEIK